jgi:tryptophanyl-tRNA synthetase
VSNLLEILAACSGVPLAEAGADVSTYGQLKKVVTEAVLSVLEPLQARYAELAHDPAYVDGVFAAGSERCREETAPLLAAARTAMGLGQGLG